MTSLMTQLVPVIRLRESKLYFHQQSEHAGPAGQSPVLVMQRLWVRFLYRTETVKSPLSSAVLRFNASVTHPVVSDSLQGVSKVEVEPPVICPRFT